MTQITVSPEPLQPEVKQGWSLSYITLTVILSILSGAVGYGLKWIFEPASRRVVTIAQSVSPNLIKIDERAAPEVAATFTLKKAPEAKLQSYFQYTVSITNSGTDGLEDAELFVSSEDPNISISERPVITTEPAAILPTISVSADQSAGNGRQRKWVIKLINPNETIRLTILSYSTASVSDPKIVATVRRSGWEAINKGDPSINQPKSLLEKNFSEITAKDVLVLILVLISSIMILIVYMRAISKVLFNDAFIKTMARVVNVIVEKQ